jgi:nucleoside diphosphate kinase
MSEPIFVINGFYMSMREKFTLPEAKLHYMTVEFDADALSWEDFRGKVLGATDPATAEDGSLRKIILDKWQELGLATEPNVGDNGVHASASPFEAMAERNNWLGVELEKDPFAMALMAAGISKETIETWSKDPQVDIGEGKKGSLFDQLEDMNASDCLAKASALAGASGTLTPYPKNQAFVFVKPHAVTDAAVAAVKEGFAAKGITIVEEGVLTGPVIDEKKLIDNHYYAIANKASLTLPKDLNPPEAKQEDFLKLFGISWADALAQDKVFNALDACKKAGLTGDQMDKTWAKTKKAGQLVKFGGGFYAGLVDPAA